MAPRSKRSRSVARSAVESRSASAPAKRHKAAEGVAAQVLTAEKRMSEELSKLSFSSPVTHVYDPIEYAWNAHEWYVGNERKW